MEEQLKTLLFDPLTGRLASAAIALFVVFAVGRLFLRSVERYVKDNWLGFTLRYVVDYRKRRVVKDQRFSRIWGEVDNSENRIHLASATIRNRQHPAFGCRHGRAPGHGGAEARLVMADPARRKVTAWHTFLTD